MCLNGEADENDSAIEGDFRAHEVGPCGLRAQQGACHGIARICGRHSMVRGSIVGAMRLHAAERRDVRAHRSAVTMSQLSPPRRRPLDDCCGRVRGGCLHCMGILPGGLALRNPGIRAQRHMRGILRVSMGPPLCRHAARPHPVVYLACHGPLVAPGHRPGPHSVEPAAPCARRGASGRRRRAFCGR